jgi:hypothetical protein
VNKGNGADLTFIDFYSCKTSRKIAALNQRRPNDLRNDSPVSRNNVCKPDEEVFVSVDGREPAPPSSSSPQTAHATDSRKLNNVLRLNILGPSQRPCVANITLLLVVLQRFPDKCP